MRSCCQHSPAGPAPSESASEAPSEPSAGLPQRRLPPTSTVPNFNQAQVFRKSGITVEASNSHSDYFQKNKTAIRAEERLALAVYAPGAFGVVDTIP